MKDRTRRFTIGLGAGTNHLQIFAADEPSRQWAMKNQYEMTVISRTVTDELRGKKLESVEREAWQPPAPEGVVTLAALRARWRELLVAAFPKELFAVTPACAPVATQSDEPKDAAHRATLAKLSGVGG